MKRGKTIHPGLGEPTQFVDWQFKAEERLALESVPLKSQIISKVNGRWFMCAEI
jgi:hypothetical protein